jgi:hypothetical protein
VITEGLGNPPRVVEQQLATPVECQRHDVGLEPVVIASGRFSSQSSIRTKIAIDHIVALSV